MSDGALRIPITGDASQFKATLSEVESSLKYFKEKLKSAKGDQIGKINFTISGLEETKNALTTFGKFADGTLGQLYQKLEQLKTLRLTIQADATALTPVNNAIDETTKKIKDLLSAGLQKPIVEAAQVSANSIQGLKNRIDELNQKKFNLDAKDDYLQIVKLNQEIDKLKTQINNLNKLGLKVDQTIDPAVNSFKNLTNTSNKSRQALTSLSLIAQDLPFGFIAIQNNLPAVISSFGALRVSALTTKGVLLSLKTALIGPAGLFLAFSVLTAGITFAIQKYGSLSNAYMALTTKTSQFTQQIINTDKAFKKYLENEKSVNEIRGESIGSIQNEIIKVNSLAKVLLDSTSSDRAKQGALADLKKASKEYFGDFKQNAIDVDKLNSSVSKYTEGLIKNSVAQGLATEAGAAFTEFLKLNQISVEIANEINNLKKANPKLNEEIDNYLAGQERILAQGGTGYKAYGEVGRYFDLSNQLTEVNGKIKVIVSSYDKLATAADLAYKEAARFIQLPDAPAVKNIKELKQELQGVIPLFDLLLPSKEQFNFDFLKDFFGPNFIKQLKESQRVLNGTQSVLKKFREESGQPNLPNAEPIFTPSAEYNQKLFDEKKLAKDFEDTKVILEEVFFAPLSDLFQNFFDTGKFAFEEFGKSILNTIKSIVSKIIATGIINLLANILLPGGGIASAALNGTATGAGGGILGAFKAAFNSILSIGKVANPNFGGVQGGGMQLAGEVVFRQRGSDLIGVINRTNGTINRVG